MQKKEARPRLNLKGADKETEEESKKPAAQGEDSFDASCSSSEDDSDWSDSEEGGGVRVIQVSNLN